MKIIDFFSKFILSCLFSVYLRPCTQDFSITLNLQRITSYSIRKDYEHEVVFSLENNCRVEFTYSRYFFFLFVFSFIVNNTSLENSLYWFGLIVYAITSEFWIVFLRSKLFKVFVFLFSIRYVNAKILTLYTSLIMCKLFKDLLSLVLFMKINEWKQKLRFSF